MSDTVLTNENAHAFYASRLNPVPASGAEPPEGKQASGESSNDDKTGETAGKPKKPIQPRINELVSERNEARDLAMAEAQRAEDERRERERLQRELDELKSKFEVLETKAPHSDEKPRPTRAEFPTDETYQEALTDWKVDQRIREREQAEAEERRKALQAQMEANLKARLDAFRKEVPDFDEVVGAADVNVAQHIYQAIVESELVGPLSVHFAKHPEEVRRLNAMSPARALAELGKLEDRLTKTETDPDPAESKPVVATSTNRHEKSKAPPPIEPLKAASEPLTKEPKDMTYAEFKAWRAKGGGS